MSQFKGFAIHHRFSHWSEPASVLVNNSIYEASFFTNNVEKCPTYTDLKGIEHKVHDQKDALNPESLVYIHEGDIHRQCSPEVAGKINGENFKTQLVIPHTTGLAPYDVYANLTYSELSVGTEFKIINVMKKSHYDLIMNTEFSIDCSFYERPTKETISINHMKEVLQRSVEEGRTKFLDMEPQEYWLNSVSCKYKVSLDICLALNWCSVRDKLHIDFILFQLRDIPKERIVVRLHSFDMDAKKYFIEHGYRIESPEISKWDAMDLYKFYIVDKTGFGLEVAYRNQGAKIYEVDSFCNSEEFAGLDSMVGRYATHLRDFGKKVGSIRSEVLDVVYPNQVNKNFFNAQNFADNYAEELMRIASE